MPYKNQSQLPGRLSEDPSAAGLPSSLSCALGPTPAPCKGTGCRPTRHQGTWLPRPRSRPQSPLQRPLVRVPLPACPPAAVTARTRSANSDGSFPPLAHSPPPGGRPPPPVGHAAGSWRPSSLHRPSSQPCLYLSFLVFQ